MVARSMLPPNNLIMVRSSAYEYWLLSTFESGQTASVLISEDMGSMVGATGEQEAFLTT